MITFRCNLYTGGDDGWHIISNRENNKLVAISLRVSLKTPIASVQLWDDIRVKGESLFLSRKHLTSCHQSDKKSHCGAFRTSPIILSAATPLPFRKKIPFVFNTSRRSYRKWTHASRGNESLIPSPASWDHCRRDEKIMPRISWTIDTVYRRLKQSKNFPRLPNTIPADYICISDIKTNWTRVVFLPLFLSAILLRHC